MKRLENADIEKTLANIKMSFAMEGLNLTDEIQGLCLSVVSGKKTLDECLKILNSKYELMV